MHAPCLHSIRAEGWTSKWKAFLPAGRYHCANEPGTGAGPDALLSEDVAFFWIGYNKHFRFGKEEFDLFDIFEILSGFVPVYPNIDAIDTLLSKDGKGPREFGVRRSKVFAVAVPVVLPKPIHRFVPLLNPIHLHAQPKAEDRYQQKKTPQGECGPAAARRGGGDHLTCQWNLKHP